MQRTSKQYDAVITQCRELFINKMKDYGSAWRILRLPSLTDQIFIKAQRIRQLQENEVQKVDEDEIPEPQRDREPNPFRSTQYQADRDRSPDDLAGTEPGRQVDQDR